MSERRWVRKWRRDAATGGFSPLPTRVVSNEEYLPLPETPEQARVAARLGETVAVNARRLGMRRRDFLGTSSGMAAAFLALNSVFGRFFAVDPVEALEPAAADARKPAGQFIFDVQTHHGATPRQQAFGPDHVLWGTDSIWWGSLQWQIEALRRFTMPESLIKRFGYRPLTADVKAGILGSNAARLYGIDPSAPRHPVPPDYISKLRAAYLEEGPRPSLTQYGWVLEG